MLIGSDVSSAFESRADCWLTAGKVIDHLPHPNLMAWHAEMLARIHRRGLAHPFPQRAIGAFAHR